MIKILTIIGARPQIIKAAAISRAISASFSSDFEEVLVHTGQHYDTNMSEVFFGQLGIPKPNYNLGVGSGSHGKQTAEMIIGIEVILVKEQPDYLLIYGDTNSTLAGALAAVKMQIPIIHVEAGLRSFNKSMPEEINRILADHVSTYLFPPTQTGVDNLRKEGFKVAALKSYTKDHPGIFNVGDVMYDNALYYAKLAAEKIDLKELYDLESSQYILCTIHRNQNTDDPACLANIVEALLVIAESNKIFLPLHPRTRHAIEQRLPVALKAQFMSHKNIVISLPVGFLEMISLEQHARLVITDSGGVQKEAFFFDQPCIILRAETEWQEIVSSGMAVLTGSCKGKILDAFAYFEQNLAPSGVMQENLYGQGNAAFEMLRIIKENH